MTAIALAAFKEEGAFLRARTGAIAAEYRLLGEWTPFASKGLSGTADTGGILPAAIGVGVLGGGGLLALEAWSAALAYPINSGARPLLSWPAFIPAPVEFGAFAAAVGALVALFVRARLTRLHHAAFELEEVAWASQGAFVLALACDVGEAANRALAILAQAGATHTRLVAP